MRRKPFNLSWVPVLVFLFLGWCPVSAAPPPGMAPSAAAVTVAVPPVLKNSPELALLMKNWDNQSALAIEVERQAPRQVLNRSAMRRIQVDTGTGKQVDLGSLFDQTFTAQRALGQQLNRIPATALVGRPQLNEAVVEFPDRLLMVRQVRMVVRDPKQAAAAAPDFASFLAPVDQAAVAQARVAALPPDQKADFRRFLSEELPLLDADDPLRLAMASGGEDAVLRAALSGAGVFEVTDQVVVQRNLFNNGGMRLSTELRPVTQQKQTPAMKQLRPLAKKQQPGASPYLGVSGPLQSSHHYQYDGGEHVDGRLEINEPFLAGFTLGQELVWERKWKFSCGFLRLTYGIGYGFGLRIPLRVEGSLTPTSIVRSAVEDPGRDLTLRLRAVAFDAPASHYSSVGLPAQQVFDGQEFVLTAGSWFSYKLYALGRNWAVGTPANSPLHQSRDFVPPLGGAAREIFSLDIPPELTNTTLSAGALKGYLQLGFVLRGSGTAVSQLTLLADDATLTQRSLALRDSGVLTEVLRLQPLAAGAPGTVQQQHYGLRIDAPRYVLGLNTAARVRVGMAVEAGSFKRSVNTDWIQVLSFDLGQINLPPHAGTTSSYQWNEGVRIFEARDPSDPVVIQKPGSNIPHTKPQIQ